MHLKSPHLVWDPIFELFYPLICWWSLGGSQILVIVNNAAMNIAVLIFFWISVLGSFRYIPRSGITGSTGWSIFNFLWYLHNCFPQCLHQSAFPLMLLGSPFSTSLPALVCWFIDGNHSDRCEVISHCGFNLHFSDDLWHWAHFHMSTGHLYVLFGVVSIQILCPFFNRNFFGVEFCKLFINSAY